MCLQTWNWICKTRRKMLALTYWICEYWRGGAQRQIGGGWWCGTSSDGWLGCCKLQTLEQKNPNSDPKLNLIRGRRPGKRRWAGCWAGSAGKTKPDNCQTRQMEVRKKDSLKMNQLDDESSLVIFITFGSVWKLFVSKHSCGGGGGMVEGEWWRGLFILLCLFNKIFDEESDPKLYQYLVFVCFRTVLSGGGGGGGLGGGDFPHASCPAFLPLLNQLQICGSWWGWWWQSWSFCCCCCCCCCFYCFCCCCS